MGEIQNQTVSTWKEFERIVERLFHERDKKLKRQIDSLQKAKQSKEEKGKVDMRHARAHYLNHPGSHLLFRGHQSSRWQLKTTLERAYPNRDFSLFDVFDYCTRVWNQLVLGETLDFRRREEFVKECQDIGVWQAENLWTTPYFSALAVLRHMGVPSPLLDWTYSPYVAAFFAFSQVEEDAKNDVAIFCFQEAEGAEYCLNYDGTAIVSLTYVQGRHERQVRQQGAYTFCVRNSEQGDRPLQTCGHERYINNLTADGQIFCKLVKYSIPSTEKRSAMKRLARMNITEASLFETKDAMARTLLQRNVQYFDELS
jgi:hypothetical protein